MHSGGIGPAIPEVERLQTYSLHRTSNEIGSHMVVAQLRMSDL